jgi:hypothetical protein
MEKKRYQEWPKEFIVSRDVNRDGKETGKPRILPYIDDSLCKGCEGLARIIRSALLSKSERIIIETDEGEITYLETRKGCIVTRDKSVITYVSYKRA